MTDPFDSPKQSIHHALDEIKEAEALIIDFRSRHSSTRIIRTDSQTGEEVHSLRVIGPTLGPKVGNIIKNSINNLRSALDYAAYSAAVAIRGGDPKKTGFPFAEDIGGVKRALQSRQLNGNPPEMHALLEGFKPYKGGNEILWAMNQIRNVNTHRFIVPVVSAAFTESVQMHRAVIRGGSMKFGYNNWDAATNEVEYLRVTPGSCVDNSAEHFVGLNFQGIEALDGKFVIPTLNLMAAETTRIVCAIEVEAIRIGRIP